MSPYVGPRWWVAGIVLFAAVVFQASVAHFLNFRSAVPSGILVAVVWYAVRADTRRAAVYGLIAGLCEDILATNTGAAWMISTTCVAIVASRLTQDFFADSVPIAATVTAVATLVRNTIFWSVMSLQGYPPGLGILHFHQTIWQAFLNAILMCVVVLVVRRWEPQSSERIRQAER